MGLAAGFTDRSDWRGKQKSGKQKHAGWDFTGGVLGTSPIARSKLSKFESRSLTPFRERSREGGGLR